MNARRLATPLAIFLVFTTAGCHADSLAFLRGGLRAEVINAIDREAAVDVVLTSDGGEYELRGEFNDGTTTILFEELPVGALSLSAVSVDHDGATVRQRDVGPVDVLQGGVTDVIIDLGPWTPCTPGSGLEVPLCMECRGEELVAADDDDRCGVISCSDLETWEMEGDNVPSGTSQCIHAVPADITTDRCVGPHTCVTASATTCSVTHEVVISAGLCATISGCESGNPQLVIAPDGTPCATEMECRNGVCVGSCVRPPTCMACEDNALTALSDDDRCGVISCSSFNALELRGSNTPVWSWQCVRKSAPDILSNRCTAAQTCKQATAETCVTSESVLLSASVCREITGCVAGGTPAVQNAPDHVVCGVNKWCVAGACVDRPVSVGCSDGTREGFVSTGTHPDIAGCSGAWSVAGVTVENQQPACNRVAGNSSSNKEGNGCSAADLCEVGWHICQGKDEVAQKSSTGCTGAVPAGAPDKSLFFAVHQHSTNISICDTSTNTNDIFGCGNLGNTLAAEKGCGVLNRFLGRTASGSSCGYNEAQPNMGPWECPGGSGPDMNEGALVTKKGCPNNSCTWDGQSVGNSDKGGVLCCRD